MKTYKFYRNFAIICGVLFLFATVVFIAGSIKFMCLNPYSTETDTLRMYLSGTLIFQTYLAYLIIACYKKWRRVSRYEAFKRRMQRNRKKDAEFSAFINNHLNY